MFGYFKIFCLSLFLLCQFLLFVNYINGFINFGIANTNLTKRINDEKNNKSTLQSNLGQEINKNVKQDQSLGSIEKVVNIAKITDFKKEVQNSSSISDSLQSSSSASQVKEEVLIVR